MQGLSKIYKVHGLKNRNVLKIPEHLNEAPTNQLFSQNVCHGGTNHFITLRWRYKYVNNNNLLTIIIFVKNLSFKI